MYLNWLENVEVKTQLKFPIAVKVQECDARMYHIAS